VEVRADRLPSAAAPAPPESVALPVPPLAGLPFHLGALGRDVAAFFARLTGLGGDALGRPASVPAVWWLAVLTAAGLECARRLESRSARRRALAGGDEP
jgi:hypothetical protein